jgi:ribosomal protein S24E
MKLWHGKPRRETQLPRPRNEVCGQIVGLQEAVLELLHKTITLPRTQRLGERANQLEKTFSTHVAVFSIQQQRGKHRRRSQLHVVEQC